MGASLAGPRAAGTLREEGFTGSLTLICDEPSVSEPMVAAARTAAAATAQPLDDPQGLRSST